MAKTSVAAHRKPRNPKAQDATLININPLKRRITRLEAAVVELMTTINDLRAQNTALAARISKLETPSTEQ